MAFQFPERLNRLDYLDLHGELKSQFEIKLSAEFLFEKRPGFFCLFPAIQMSLKACEHIKRHPETLMLDKIHTLFSSTIIPEVCWRWFGWETVELPKDMLQRLAVLDELERETQRMNTSSYFFPDPLNSHQVSAKVSHQVPNKKTSHWDDSDYRDSLASEGLSSAHLSILSSATPRSSLHSLSSSDYNDNDNNNDYQPYFLPSTLRRAPTKEHNSVAALLLPHPLPSIIAPAPCTPPLKLYILSDSDDSDGDDNQPYLLRSPLSPSRAPAKEHNLVAALPLPLARPPPFIVAPCSPPLKSHKVPAQQHGSNLDKLLHNSPQKTTTNAKGNVLEATLQPSCPFVTASLSPKKKITATVQEEATLQPSRPFIIAPLSSKKKIAATVQEHDLEAALQPPRPPPFIIAPSSPSLKSKCVPSQHNLDEPRHNSHPKKTGANPKATQQRGCNTDELSHKTTTDVKVQAPDSVRIMQGHDQGISITNHIHITADPCFAERPLDAHMNQVSASINACLQDLKLHSMTMSKIWRCIEQKEGYGPSAWQAILVKLDIPEDHMASILAMMANASNHYLISHKAEHWTQLEALTTALDSAKSGYAEEAIHIAEIHGRSLKWTRSQLFLKSRLLQQRQAVNLWNGFVRAKLMEANEDREKGERIKLTEFIARNKKELDRTYSKLTLVQKQVYKAQILEAREKKQRTARANPKAVRHDVSASFASMDREWTALCARTGTEGFYIAVHGGIEDLSEPRMFVTQKAEKFIKDVLHMEPRHLGLKLESYIVSGLDEGVTPNRQRPLNKLISECRTFIQDALKSILHKNKTKGSVKMNYTNYERKIVEGHGIELVNWPLSGPVRNPSKVGGRSEVENLWAALDKGICHWVTLSDDERQARMQLNRERHAKGELVYIMRKQKTKAKEPKSHVTINMDDESDGSSSDSD